MKALLSALLLAPLAAATSHAAMTVISEDFEGYTDTADLGTAWSLGDGTLDTTNGNPGQSLAHPGTGGSFSGANTNSMSFAAIVPTSSQPIVFSASIFDDGSSANKRVSAGMRAAAGANIIEMGMYNSPSHYAYRTVLFESGDATWVAFSNLVDDAGMAIGNAPINGWHTYTATITGTDITFTLDLNSDGNINATSVANVVPTAAGFDIVRLGGPSDLSSGGGGANFDNVRLEIVPEPSAALLAIAGAAFGFVRRRR